MAELVSLAAATAAADLAEKVAKVWERLNTSRTCLIELANHTQRSLRLVNHSHSHGGFAEPPNDELPGQTAEVFGSQSLSGSVLTGTEGAVTYRIGDADATVTIRWNVPFVGGNSCASTTAGWQGSTSFQASCITGPAMPRT
jgi:hypothetical protein